jgi:hypothetical protein
MVDAADAALLHQLVGESDGGDAAIGVPDEGFAFRMLFCGIVHYFCFGEGAGEGFFAGDVFAGGEGGESHFEMPIVGGGDVDEINFWVGDGLLPVGGGILPVPFFLEALEFGGVAAADGMHDWVGCEIEEFVHFQIGVAVGTAHEFLADEADVDRLFWHGWIGSLAGGRRGARILGDSVIDLSQLGKGAYVVALMRIMQRRE